MLDKCIRCGSEIPGKYKIQKKYCSDTCKRRAKLERGKRGYKRYNIYSIRNVDNSVIGAVGEMRVSADLLLNGYEVFRSVSPACSCDLIAMKNNNIFRIEVTTGHYTTSGKVSYASHNSNKYDILAIVLSDKINYSRDIFKI